MRELTGEEPEIFLADQRYGFIGGLVKETVKRRTGVEQRLSLTDKIDRIVTNRYLGLPIFLFSMWAVFLRKAGTIIFSVVILIWLLSVLPWGVEPGSKESLIGHLGAIFAPVFAPAGFGTWEAAAALIFGLLAKEVVVGTLGVIYGVGEEAESLIPIIQQHWTPLSAYAFMAMCLIYIPCAATIGAIKRETNS
ncbi:nucleoside recognition domain-containing protein [Desulfofundulus thermosubterraneus]|uniref:Nucleoside recognition n=1 Tax=Desulfofundulus thermosubterraneus DSM 16057 TaxID=1121432 RepID=A0A1M6JSQ0_9FIRM|nr:Nucleoside recognition [Desulfofundulus thermosubterraneus DSM 16057]